MAKIVKYMTVTTGNHNKEYVVVCNETETEWAAAWGPIGKMNGGIRKFVGKGQAITTMQKKMKEGYKPKNCEIPETHPRLVSCLSLVEPGGGFLKKDTKTETNAKTGRMIRFIDEEV